MIKILFVCHGNICRSPTAEFIMKDIVKKSGREAEFEIASAATSSEELGNGVYPPARRMLEAHGIDCSGKRARRMRAEDYEHFDLIIGMDGENMDRLLRFYKGDPEGKIHNLLDYAGRVGEEIADPWYTRDFGRAWDDIFAGCQALFAALTEDCVTLDLSRCQSREELYDVLAEAMDWPDWYGRNLDALWDIVTGLEHKGARFRVVPPEPSAPEAVREYAGRMAEVLSRAGALEE